MPHPDGFQPLPPAGALLWGAVPDVGSIIFYATIRCRLGYHVTPKSWHAESEQPLLRCYLDYGELSKDLKWDNNLKEWNDICAERRRIIFQNGWLNVDAREGAEKYIHVDELEKIEGLPPEGAF